MKKTDNLTIFLFCLQKLQTPLMMKWKESSVEFIALEHALRHVIDSSVGQFRVQDNYLGRKPRHQSHYLLINKNKIKKKILQLNLYTLIFDTHKKKKKEKLCQLTVFLPSRQREKVCHLSKIQLLSSDFVKTGMRGRTQPRRRSLFIPQLAFDVGLLVFD